ncbi:MAG: hypothetical protein KatS3mg027_2247 [Bacteroidia bacterium]|nr:MAG: hypothetical protein KatS3mg027_2247 [Bacteroidia bacterium]
MLKNRGLYSIFFTLFIFHYVLSQEVDYVEYYLGKIKSSKTDTERLSAYSQLTEYCEVEEIPVYAEEALLIGNKLLNKELNDSIRLKVLRWVNGVKNNYAFYYYEKGAYKEALSLWDALIDSYDSIIKVNKGISEIYKDYSEVINNKASAYESVGFYNEAIKLYFHSLKLSEAVGDRSQIARILNNLGYLHKNIDDIDKAIKFYNMALEIREKTQDSLGIALILNNIARIYLDKKEPIKAEGLLLKSLSIYNHYNDLEGIATVKCNLGKVCIDLMQFDKSKRYLFDAWFCYLNLDKEVELASVFDDLANLFMIQYINNSKTNYLDSAFKYIRKAEWIALKYKLLYALRDVYNIYSRFYTLKNDFKKGFEFHNKVDSIYKIINESELQKLALKQELEYEAEKTLNQKQLEHSKEMAIANEKNQKQKIILMAVFGGLILSLIFVVLIYQSMRQLNQKNKVIAQQKQEVEQQKEIIEQKQKDILDSIHYSKLIQKSILPHRSDIWRAIPQSFVLYKPKDIVAGDFYWFHVIGDYCLLAVADCTGHGVPGAFMSILNNDKLNEAVNFSTEVDEILYYVNINVKKTLKQFEKDSISKDGMDVILVKVPYTLLHDMNVKDISIEFAGANRPLYVYNSNSKSVEEYKTTKASIGGFTEQNQVFEKFSLTLHRQDCVYLTTDGYIDQFGGEKNKKLMSSGFRKLIQEIGELHYQDQKEKLFTFFEKWKGSNEQVDDVCILGFKV